MPIVTASTRSTFAFVAAASTNGRVVRLENADGEVHSLAYDGGAGRLVARKNLSTGASARRVFDESGTLVTTFSKTRGASSSLRTTKCWTAWSSRGPSRRRDPTCAGRKQAALNRAASQLESVQRQVSAILARTGDWLQPGVHVQELVHDAL
jgi:YD repeat-containing protein